MTATIIVVAIVALAAAIAVFALQRSARSEHLPVSAQPSSGSFLDDGFSSAGEPFAIESPMPMTVLPAAVDDAASGTVVAAAPAGPPSAPSAPAWPSQVVGRAEPLDDEARARLLGDLGIVRALWCVPILAQAYEEESAPALRCAALLALAGLGGSTEARAVLARAAKSADEQERAIAEHALATTQPAATP